MSQLNKNHFSTVFENSEKNRTVIRLRLNNPELLEMEKKLRKGYKEMGSINLSLAKMCFYADSEVLRQCEEKLTECE